MKRLNWKNAFKWNNKLDSGQTAIRDSVIKFNKKVLLPRLDQDYKFSYDRNLFKQFGTNGFFEPMEPIVQGLMACEIESVDSGYRSAWSVQSSLVIYCIEKFGTDQQKDEYLPGLKSGDTIGCFGLTEPCAGSDPSRMETTVRNNGNNYLINGSKMWITNAPLADIFIIWAKNINGEVGGYIVDRNSRGLETRIIDNKLSLQTSPTGIVYLDNVAVPGHQVLNVKGMKAPLQCLNKARYGIGWGALGAGRDCLEKTIDYTTFRNQFGKPLISFQLVQAEIADMVSEWILAMNACYTVCEMIGHKPDPFDVESSAAISIIKRNSTVKALNIARRCRDLLGANGIVLDSAVMRHSCNLESVVTYEGTQSMHLLNIARAVTGISAFD